MAGRIPVSRIGILERQGKFTEIELALRPQQAVAEAMRCLKCDNPPCDQGCPAGVPVKQFITYVRSKNFRGAISLIRQANILAGICARICPQDHLCESKCSNTDLAEPIAIGALQRFVADEELNKGHARLETPKPANGKRVACVGAGPASIGCAVALAREGCAVEIFDMRHETGGLLRHGIPEFRLPPAVVIFELTLVESLGVTFHPQHEVKDARELLKQGFDAVFVGIGLDEDRQPDCPDLPEKGVVTGRAFLEEVRRHQKREEPPPYPGENVIVVGGGNVAMDCAATAQRLGAKVTVVYRRGVESLPAWQREYHDTLEEGVGFEFFTCVQRPIINNEGKLTGVRCIRTRPGDPDSSGRPAPVMVEGSEFELPADLLIYATGQQAGKNTAGMPLNSKGLIEVDSETGETGIPGIFAGGDITNGGTTVVQAVAEGKRAARAILAAFQPLGENQEEATPPA